MFAFKVSLLIIYTSIIIYGIFISTNTNHMSWYIASMPFSYLLMIRLFCYKYKGIRNNIVDIAIIFYCMGMLLSGIIITSFIESDILQIMTICLSIFYLFFLVGYILFTILRKELDHIIFPYNLIEKIMFYDTIIYFNNSCPICLVDFKHKEKIYQIIECKHLYHYDCINDALKYKNRCPMCKHEII